jgi:hypothetical protein
MHEKIWRGLNVVLELVSILRSVLNAALNDMSEVDNICVEWKDEEIYNGDGITHEP